MLFFFNASAQRLYITTRLFVSYGLAKTNERKRWIVKVSRKEAYAKNTGIRKK